MLRLAHPRLTSLAVVSLFGSVLALDAAHYAFVGHERCVEHQEVVHGHGHGAQEEPVAEVDWPDSGLRSAPTTESQHDHDVCVLAVFADPAPHAPPTTSALAPDDASSNDSGPQGRRVRRTLTALQVAPKNSPPV